VFSSKIYKIFTNYELVGSISNSDVIVVYQLPGEVPILGKRRKTITTIDSDGTRVEEELPGNQDELIVMPVYCAVADDKESENDRYRSSLTQFGGPIILAMKKKDATSVENVYREIVQQVERYAMMKLFEERRDVQMNEEHNNTDKMDTSDEDVAIAAQVDHETDEDGVHKQQPVRTAAAVTAAGGRLLEPMRKLFSMQVFSEKRSYGRNHELFSTGMHGWDNSQMTDLFERAGHEKAQRERFYAPKPTEESNEEATEEPSTVDIMESIDENADMLRETSQQGSDITDMDDDDVVEDASSIVPSVSSNMVVSLPRVPTPPAQIPSVVLPSKPPSPIVIRQGEGIVLQWRKQRAVEVFGPASSSSSSPYKSVGESKGGVYADAWDDMDEMHDPLDATSDSKAAGSKKNVTLSDCLDEFTREEELGEDDLWYCPRCKQHQRATKKFDLWRMPEILVVHLKRFSHTRTWRDKIDALIDFPLKTLDLTQRVLSTSGETDLPEDEKPIYDLFAVDNHFGGMGGGHCKLAQIMYNFLLPVFTDILSSPYIRYCICSKSY
jgi:ubiquitin carboxyl-terminal hydrolase 4/11/15